MTVTDFLQITTASVLQSLQTSWLAGCLGISCWGGMTTTLQILKLVPTQSCFVCYAVSTVRSYGLAVAGLLPTAVW